MSQNSNDISVYTVIECKRYSKSTDDDRLGQVSPGLHKFGALAKRALFAETCQVMARLRWWFCFSLGCTRLRHGTSTTARATRGCCSQWLGQDIRRSWRQRCSTGQNSRVTTAWCRPRWRVSCSSRWRSTSQPSAGGSKTACHKLTGCSDWWRSRSRPSTGRSSAACHWLRDRLIAASVMLNVLQKNNIRNSSKWGKQQTPP